MRASAIYHSLKHLLALILYVQYQVVVFVALNGSPMSAKRHSLKAVASYSTKCRKAWQHDRKVRAMEGEGRTTRCSKADLPLQMMNGDSAFASRLTDFAERSG